jgi:hypothetical protein
MNRFRSAFVGMSVLCAIFASSAESQGRTRPSVDTATSSHGGPTNSGRTGRLIVQRAPNFGTDLAVRLLIDGKKAGDIPRNQHYGGVLAAGRHVVTALSLPNTQARRPTSIGVTIKSGKVYIFTAMWEGDRLILRPSDFYMPTVRANAR